MIWAALTAGFGPYIFFAAFTLPALWFALWTTRDHRRRRAYAAHIADWPDAVLPEVRAHYVGLVRTYWAARFPKPNLRNAQDALIMATVVQERIDLAAGRAPSRYLRSRRRILKEVRR